MKLTSAAEFFCLVQAAYVRYREAKKLCAGLEGRPLTRGYDVLLREARKELARAHDGIFSLLERLFDPPKNIRHARPSIQANEWSKTGHGKEPDREYFAGLGAARDPVLRRFGRAGQGDRRKQPRKK